MAAALMVTNVSIRQDHEGRFCVNDLHQAAGGEKRHQPSNWLALQQTQALVRELIREQKPDALGAPIPVESRQGLGTFVTKELVYAYAMWVSPEFHLRVIRAYDRMTREGAISLPDFNDPVAAARAWADKAEQVQRLARLAHAQRETLEAARPAVEFHEAVAQSNDTLSIGQFAKLMGVGEVRLFKLMRDERILITGGAKHNLPFQSHIDCGRFEVRESVYTDPETQRNHLRFQTRITPKGQMWLQKKFFPAQAEVLTEALEAAAEPGDLLAAGPAQLTGQDIDRDVPAPSADQNRSDLARQTLDAARKMLGRRPQVAGSERSVVENPRIPMPHPDQEREASRYLLQSQRY